MVVEYCIHGGWNLAIGENTISTHECSGVRIKNMEKLRAIQMIGSFVPVWHTFGHFILDSVFCLLSTELLLHNMKGLDYVHH